MSNNRGAGLWLPAPPNFIARWLTRATAEVEENQSPFLPVIREFQQLVENDPTLYMYFTSMFDEMPNSPPYDKDAIGAPQIRDYLHMLESFNHIIQMAPPWNDAANSVGLAGFPLNAILNWPMATPSGRSAFLDPRVNAMFKKMFDVWAKHLVSPASTDVLSSKPNGWLGSNAIQALTSSAQLDGNTNDAFHDIYNCDPCKPFLGFTSWDSFFTRTFKDGVRPVSSPTNDSIIVNPCESAPYQLAENVSRRDRFWVKAQPYSLENMLLNDELVPRFVGGTIYQAFLSSVTYHRWHSPVAGTVIKAYNIPGAYYSESPLNGFAGKGADPEAPNRSQAYISAVASRAAIFIQSDNDDIGTVCFLPVGMAEVSSCEIGVRPGQHVDKGQEIGMFHFGGSTFCLIFEKGVDLSWEKQCLPPYPQSRSNVAVRRKMATVVGPKVSLIEHECVHFRF